jgi:hypothetical protein
VINQGYIILFRTHLKNRILVQDRGGAEFQTGGILLYGEDLKRGTNKDIGPKDIFEMGSSLFNVIGREEKYEIVIHFLSIC